MVNILLIATNLAQGKIKLSSKTYLQSMNQIPSILYSKVECLIHKQVENYISGKC